jgi:intein-like protein with splicing domain
LNRKDYFGTTALIRVIYELYCLKSPTDTLGLGKGEIIHIVPISHMKEAARRVVFQGISRKLHLSPFWKGRFEDTTDEIRFPGKNIVIIGGGSNENAALGLNVFASLCDECLAYDSLITMADGSLRQIGDLVGLDSTGADLIGILAYNGKRVVESSAVVKPATVADVFLISLENGRSLKATKNHPLLVRSHDGTENYVWVEDLAPGDNVVVTEQLLRKQEVSVAGHTTSHDFEISTSRVVSVIYAGREQTYDLMSEPHGNFIANGIVVHNTNFMGKSRKSDVTTGGKKEDKSESLYDSLRRRIRGTYAAKGFRGKLFMVSSKKSVHDFTERRLREAMNEQDPGVYCLDFAPWDIRPNSFPGQKWWKGAVDQHEGRVHILGEIRADGSAPPHKPGHIWFKFPEEHLKEFQNDPIGAARDIVGIAMESFRPFFSNRQAIDDMQKADRPHPFHVHDWDTGRDLKILWENLVMSNVHGDPVPRCCPNASRHCHIDLSKNKDGTGICVGHVAGEVEVSRTNPETGERHREEAPFIHIDLVLRAKAPRAGEIDHQLIRGLIYKLRDGGIPIKSVTADTWMGLPNLQMIEKHGFETDQVSTQRTLDPYLAAQSALYERRIESPVYPLLAKELRELELNDQGTKVDHPKTGCFTGETRIPLLDGSIPTIEELVGRGYVWVYSSTPTGVVVPGKARARFTKSVTKLVDVILDSGAIVRCTPGHPFMLRNGSYKSAKNLIPAIDRLMPPNVRTWSVSRDSKKLGYGSWSDFAEPSGGHSHKVRVVIPVKLAAAVSVYDLEVDVWSNFALSAGVFVHNSKDLSDAWASTVFSLTKNHRVLGGGGVSRGVTELQTGTPGQAAPTSDGNFRWPDEPQMPKHGEAGDDELPSFIIS